MTTDYKVIDVQISLNHLRILTALRDFENGEISVPRINIQDAEECEDLKLVEAVRGGYRLTERGRQILKANAGA